MKHTKIRRGVFETNSSSTHCISIPTGKNDIAIPDFSIVFGFGEFGWEHCRINSLKDKADYLYTAIYCCASNREVAENNLEKLKSFLDDSCIEYKFKDSAIYTKSGYWEINGYIDHADELNDFLDYVLESPDNLLNYLFGGVIVTGNDNDDSYDVTEEVGDGIKFYKGN